MKSLRATRRYRPCVEAVESRVVLDAGFPFAVAIGDTIQASSADFSSKSRVGVDSAGNVFVAGNFADLVHYGTGPGEPTDQSSGPPLESNIFIAKYSPTGTLLWHEALQPASNAASAALGGIAVDGAGDVYLSGTLSGSVNVNPIPGQQNLLDSSNGPGLLMKLAPDGTLDFAEQFGDSTTVGGPIALDGQGHLVVSWGSSIASYTLDGSSRWSEPLGAPANAIAADPSGNILLTGSFTGTINFDPGPGTFDLTSQLGTGIFALKLDPNGSFLWAKGMLLTSFLPTDFASASSVSTDSAGNVYLAGAFNGTVNFDPGPGTFTLTPPDDATYGPSGNGFVMKLDPSGNFAWAESPGNNPFGDSVMVDSSGQVFVSGSIAPEFAVVHPTLLSTGSPVVLPRDGTFIMRLDSQGELQGVKESCASDYVQTDGIAAAPGGNVAIVGEYTTGQDFGSIVLPQLTYSAGTTVASYFVAEASPMTASAGATLSQLFVGSPSTPSFLVSGVAPDATVTLFSSPGGPLPPGTRVEVGSRVGPGVITVAPGNGGGDLIAVPENPISGFGFGSNTLQGIVVENAPSIDTSFGAPGFKNSDGTVIPAGGVTSDPRPIVFGVSEYATSVELLDGSGKLLGTAQVTGGIADPFSSFQIQLPPGLAGRIQLYLQASDTYGYTSPLTATSTITIETNSGGGGGGGGGGGTGATGPVVNSVTIASPKRGPKVIQIVFSGKVGPVTIEALFDLSHFSLTSAGHDRRFGTKDDKTLKLSKLTYNAATQVVTLHTKQALSTAYPLKFTISGLLSTGLYTALLGPKAKR